MSDNALLHIKLAIAAILAVVGRLLGGWDILLESLITLTCLDVLTGVLVAVVTHSVSSNVALIGIAKKIGIYTLIAVVVAGGQALGHDDLRSLVIGFFIGTEIISIVENWAKIGLPIPKKLTNILEAMKNDNSEKS